jgi:hypothetical protein
MMDRAGPPVRACEVFAEAGKASEPDLPAPVVVYWTMSWHSGDR